MELTMAHLYIRDNTDSNCTKDTCPASDSIYGYAPSLVASWFFLILFGLATLAFFVQTILYRRGWLAFGIVLSLGCVLECVGYVARLMLHNDPFSSLGFKLSIVLLTFAPAFMSGGIYLLLKHVCLAIGPQYSRVRPKLYTWIFVSCDIISIILQAAGGAISAIATGQSLLNVGVDVMIAGLAFQVFTLVVFGLLAGECYARAHRNAAFTRMTSRASSRFKIFSLSTTVAYLCILIRCCYRVAELSGGWGNPIMRKEAEFIVLDSAMVAIAVILLTAFHPGVFFEKPTQSNVPDSFDVQMPSNNVSGEVMIEAKRDGRGAV